MKTVVQRIVQILTLALFVLLFLSGKMQLWMVIFVVGVLLSLLLGRIFCGWVCPINTLMKPITWLKRKLHIKSITVPNWIKKPWVRYTMLGLFLALVVLTMVTGKKLPVFPALLGLGVLMSLFFPEEIWHRYLCPYGTILSLPSRKAKHNVTIDAKKCTNCGLCKKVCPAVAVTREDHSHSIIGHNCLVCMDCQRKCPQDAVHYQ